jgi:5-methylcytosine-specific restriction endonuclease McrA/transposase
MPADYKHEAWLYEKYHEKGMTQAEMAEICGVSPRTIREWMNRHDVETRDLEGEDHPLYGRERDEAVKEKISETLSGRDFSPETRQKIADAHRGRTLSSEIREKISATLEGTTRPESTRRKMSRSSAGENNSNWRGGYSRRYGAEWATARRRALDRDVVCRHCGHDGSEYRLEVHHVIPVRAFLDSDDARLTDAHDLENLVVLCKQCHPKADHGKLGFDSDIEPP